jgi:hypothetical protein
MSIKVMLDRVPISIDREVFEALFEQSTVRSYAKVTRALETGSISFRDLVDHARKAEIPYPLFFAPLELVNEQLRIKRERLLQGFSAQREFSMNSRKSVDLAQVELIVKNLQFKQAWMRKDKTLARNPVVGMLKKSNVPVAEEAAKLMKALSLEPGELGRARNKRNALALLVNKLEARNILVAQSAKDYMPQQLPKGKIFSGMTVKDTKLPFIFIASGDEGEPFEPTGRRIFTLALLAVLVARGRFATVTYSGHTSDDASNREYEITAEMLMPEAAFREVDLSHLGAIAAASDKFMVTPSAVVMRAQRLKILSREDADDYLTALADAFGKIENTPRNPMLAMNALRKFNGHECSRRMLSLHDSGVVNTTDFCRVMFSNAYRNDRAISDYRAGLRFS